MLLSDHLFQVALPPIKTYDDLAERLKFMINLSLEYLMKECPTIVDANSYLEFTAQLSLMNNIWNHVRDQLPKERQFYVRDAFRLYYADLSSSADGMPALAGLRQSDQPNGKTL